MYKLKVVVNDESSDECTPESGVPQGFQNLEPLLFIIYINGITLFIYLSSAVYADDMKIEDG